MIAIDTLSKEELVALLPLDIYKNLGAPYCMGLKKNNLINILVKGQVLKEIANQLEEKEIDAYDYEGNLFYNSEVKYKYFYELLNYQYEIRNEVLDRFEDNKRILMHLPTGTGKTKTASHIVSELINKKDLKVIWLAHEKILLDQGYDEFDFTFTRLKRKEIKLKKNKNYEKVEKNEIMFISYQKLYQYKQRNIKLEADLIIADECHRMLASTYKQAIEYSIACDGKILGLTATPGRTLDDIEEDQKVSRFFNHMKISSSILRNDENGPISYLINKNILSQPEFQDIEFPFSVDTNCISDFKMKKVIEDDFKRNIKITNQCIDLMENGKKIMLFAASITHANNLFLYISAKGYSVSIVHGEMKTSNMKYSLNMFQEGGNKLLIVVDKLTTGYDNPEINCIYITRNTTSPVLFNQMVGRGLRGKMMGGTEDCVIYSDVKKNILTDLDELFEFYDTNYWRNNDK